MIDFTDAKNPVEIAYFDRGPVDEEQLVTGGYWSAYWYNGRIYATEITRGSTSSHWTERIPHARGNRRRRGCALSRRAVQPADADAGDLARRSRPRGGRQPQGWLIANEAAARTGGVSDARTERNQRHRGRAPGPAGGGGARLVARYQSRFGAHARHAARALDLSCRRPRHRGYRAGARSPLAGPRARHSRHRDQSLPAMALYRACHATSSVARQGGRDELRQRAVLQRPAGQCAPCRHRCADRAGRPRYPAADGNRSALGGGAGAATGGLWLSAGASARQHLWHGLRHPARGRSRGHADR